MPPVERPAGARPPGRYDERPRRLGRGPVAAIVVLATVFVAWVLWAALGAASPDVRSQLLAFRIESDRAVSARIEVTADARRAVTCTVQAEDRTREPVGVRRLTVPAGTEGTRRAATTVSTRARAVTVVLVGCRLAPVSSA
jgi:uncharacterized protein DUF4307